jgi:hypothetical protein
VEAVVSIFDGCAIRISVIGIRNNGWLRDLEVKAAESSMSKKTRCRFWLKAKGHLLIAQAKGNYGYNSEDRQDEQETQVFDPASQPLQHLRPSARVSAQVRFVPAVLPRTGAQG